VADLERIVDEAARRNPETAFERGWKGGRAFEREVCAKAGIQITPEIIGYIVRYGGRCRDCADHQGICPNSFLPCADADKAIRRVLEAFNYGVTNGFLRAEFAERGGIR